MIESSNSEASTPSLRFARREAWFVIVYWLVSMIFVVGYCYLLGYARHTPPPRILGMELDLSARDQTLADLRLVFGIPTWVLWGVVVPWFVSLGVTTWFALCFFRDEDLGEDKFGVVEATM